MTKKESKLKGFYKSLIDEYKQNKITLLIYLALRAIVLAIGVLLFIGGNYEGAFLCLFTLILFLLPAFVQTKFNIELPSVLEIIIMLFAFAAEILGELAEYYLKIPIWDTMLHTTTGFLAAAVGLSLIDLLNRSDRFKFKLSPFFVALVSFCFSMTIGVLWEFFEFSADVLLRTDMQKDVILHSISSVALNPSGRNVPVVISGITDVIVNGKDLGLGGYIDIGLYDTMKDLLVNFLGAVVFSIFGFFYAKYQGRGKAARLVRGLKMEPKASNNKESKE